MLKGVMWVLHKMRSHNLVNVPKNHYTRTSAWTDLLEHHKPNLLIHDATPYRSLTMTHACSYCSSLLIHTLALPCSNVFNLRRQWSSTAAEVNAGDTWHDLSLTSCKYGTANWRMRWHAVGGETSQHLVTGGYQWSKKLFVLVTPALMVVAVDISMLQIMCSEIYIDLRLLPGIKTSSCCGNVYISKPQLVLFAF